MNTFKTNKNLVLSLIALTMLILTGCPNNDTVPGDGDPEIKPLPVIYINTENEAPIVSKDDYVNGTFKIAGEEQTADFENASLRIRGRGNSTWKLPKKPYRLNFDTKTSFFNLPARKNWVLLADFYDPTFIANKLAFHTAEVLEMEYTHSGNKVELYLNGEYQGIYTLTEHKEIGEGRIPVIEDDISLFIEFDVYYDEVYKFMSNILELPVMINHPESDQGVANASELINHIEDLMFADNYLDNWEELSNLMDMNALAKFMLVQELMRNTDANSPASTLAYRNSIPNSKLVFGPVWDFDSGLGTKYYINTGGSTEYYNIYFIYSDGLVNTSEAEGTNTDIGKMIPFYQRIIDYPQFKIIYKDIWNTKLANYNFDSFIDESTKNIRPLAQKDYDLWKFHKFTTYKNYDEAISMLKQWLKTRKSYLNTQINGL